MKKITLLMAVLMWSSMFYAQDYLPIEGFESFPPTGWSVVAGVGHLGADWVSTTSRFNFGSKSTFVVDTDAFSDTWLISPVMNLSGATSPELTYYDNVNFKGFANTHDVLYSTNYTGSGDPAVAIWTTLNPTIGTEDTWVKNGPYPLATTSSTVYIAFHYQAATGPENGAQWFLDDVLVRETPTCLEPLAASFTNVTNTTATFSWTPQGAETLWDVELVDITASSTPTGAPTQTGVTNPHIFTALTPQNQYDAYVRADCGAGDKSSWFGPFAFITINDDCISASVVTHETSIPNAASATATNGSILGASGSGLAADTCSGGANDTEDVWFSFVANSPSANVTIEAGNIDIILMVYSGNCAGLTNIGCKDDGLEFAGEELNLSGLTFGDTYYIRVFDYYAVPPASPNFTVKVWTSSVLSNNEFDAENAFRYYPNPVNNELNLRAQNTIENVSVYNMLGQEVLRVAPNTNSSTINMSALQTGAYFIRVTINGVTETKQIIKR